MLFLVYAAELCPQSPSEPLLQVCLQCVCQTTSQANKPDAKTPKPDAKTLNLVSIQLLICCLQFLLWKHQTAIDAYMTAYMTTCPELGLQRSRAIFADQNLDPGRKHLNRRHVSDHPLVIHSNKLSVIGNRLAHKLRTSLSTVLFQ